MAPKKVEKVAARIFNAVRGNCAEHLATKVHVIAPFARNSLRLCRKMGFKVGKKLHRTAKTWAKDPTKAVTDGRKTSANMGRPRKETEKVAAAWRSRSYESGTLTGVRADQWFLKKNALFCSKSLIREQPSPHQQIGDIRRDAAACRGNWQDMRSISCNSA